MIKFLPLGGAGEIGANSYYLNIDGTGILLDCGMHPRKSGAEALPNFNLIRDEPLDFAIISHAHHDHIGALQELVRQFPHVQIIMTKQTREIASLTLPDSAVIKYERAGSLDKPLEEVYNDISRLVESIRFNPYNEPFYLEGIRHYGRESIQIEFFPAGHILGSAFTFITNGEVTIAYTGDVNLGNQALIQGAEFPDRTVDTLIIECTLGSTEQSQVRDWNDEVGRFGKTIQKILSDGTSILIPVFAVGKFQEILAILYHLMIKGRIPHTPIYTGGIARKISQLYDVNRYVVPRIDKEFLLSEIPQQQLNEVERVEKLFQNQCIVIASSGMMIEGTTSFKLVRRWLRQKNAAICVVGYMDPETPGYKVAHAKRGEFVKLSELIEPIKVECTIEEFRFTAHSRLDGLLKIVERLKAKRVVLVHGDEAAIDRMGYEILKSFPKMKVHSAEIGKEIVISSQ